jgi:guanosine-3',5'-bis(diphosphate) 3'-pyrophosphohydrolase
LTDDKSLPKAERKRLQVEHAPKMSRGAKQIKLADKISNIRDVTDHPPARWSIKRRLKYVDWGVEVAAGLRGSNLELEKLFDATVKAARRAIK